MTPRAAMIHPDHAAEQAYLERVHEAEEQSRERAARAPEAAPDRHSARKARERMLKRLSEPIDPEALCFGRIDDEKGRVLYLGRGAVHSSDNELLVINWRLPVAGPFYEATRTEPCGLARRRRFQVDQERLLGIVDDNFTATTQVATPVSSEVTSPTDAEPDPQVVDAILGEMERARGAEMRDIVATIEARQYELISDLIDGVLVVQGGPGSGKTAIALHRAAWLLYNHQDKLERAGVLVVGPNRAFMEYVAQVLPSLGETAVVQSAVDRLPSIEGVRVRGTDTDDVARIKGDIRMASVIKDAVAERVRLPSEDVVAAVGRIPFTMPRNEILALIANAHERGQSYLRAREIFRRELTDLAQRSIDAAKSRFRSGPDASEIEAAVAASGGPLDRIWPTVTAPEVLRDLFNSRQRLKASAAALSEQEREALYRERQRLLKDEEWTSSDIALLDEADVLVRGITSSYGYVLADEAQDLSPMQLRMVMRRSGDGRATLVGDIAQATGPTRFGDWPELLTAAAVNADPRIAELAIGYRVPRQIMELAATLLPRIAPTIVVPRAVREGPEDPRVLRTTDAELADALVSEVATRLESDRSLGIIGPSRDLDQLRVLLAEAGYQPGDVLVDGLARQVTVLSAAQAKGLEFDHVVVVDPNDIAGPAGDWAYVYIAVTRATRTLSVLHRSEQPFALDDPPAPAPVAEPVLQLPETDGVEALDRGVQLGARYTEALMQAKFLHAEQHRRGTHVPYLAHLQAVAALVLEDGGTEDEAIAALLHDAVEDNGPQVLDQIAKQFGLGVARIVAVCTDPEESADASWKQRKEEHILALEQAGPQVRRVALAEKLDNSRALLRDYRRFGERVWTRMNVDAEDLLWYFSALADLFVTERPGDMASELQATVERLLELASAPDPVG